LLIEYGEGFVILRENRVVILIELAFMIVWIISFVVILFLEFFNSGGSGHKEIDISKPF